MKSLSQRQQGFFAMELVICLLIVICISAMAYGFFEWKSSGDGRAALVHTAMLIIGLPAALLSLLLAGAGVATLRQKLAKKRQPVN